MDRVAPLLRSAYYLVRERLDADLRDLGVSGSQYGALAHLAEHEGSSVAQLARRALVTPQRMHQVISQLEEAGLVTREPHPDLERVLRTRLTDAGRHLLDRCQTRADALEQRALRGLGDTETAQFRAALQTITTNLGET